MFLVAGSGGMLSRKPTPRSTASSSNTSTEDSHSHSHTHDTHDNSNSNSSTSGSSGDIAAVATSSSCRARINEALSSLGSSSVALHHQGITSLMSPPTFHNSAVDPLCSPPGGCRSTQNARTRLMIIDSMLSSSTAADYPSTSAVRLEMYQETLDIQKWVVPFPFEEYHSKSRMMRSCSFADMIFCSFSPSVAICPLDDCTWM